jgi:general stress protein YciG
MSGTVEGGKRAAAKNLAKNPDFYRVIGKLGGSAPNATPKGFAAMAPELRRLAGKKGGAASRRSKKSEEGER